MWVNIRITFIRLQHEITCLLHRVKDLEDMLENFRLGVGGQLGIRG